MSMRGATRVAATLAGLAVLTSAAMPWASAQKKKPGTPAPATTAEGVAVYQKSGCGGCHAIGGKGGKAGPDLSHVGKSMKAAALSKYIRTPKSVNPKSKMPAYGADRVGDKELKALVAYLGSLK